MWLMYLVYGANFNDVLAIFPRSPGGLAAAQEFIAAHGGTWTEGEIPTPFYATPNVPVTPTT